MWALDNRTAYAADRNWVRDIRGAHHWIVAVKATFELDERGQLRLADEQLPPTLAPEYHGADGVSSLRYDTDLGPKKGQTDVWVNGEACAPGDRPVKELAISLRVGAVNKVLSVRGENVYYSGVAGLTTTSPRPFVRIPVVYERAYGGTDTTASDPINHRFYGRNPIGVGFATSPSHVDQKPGPNVVYPGKDPARSGPAGFGAIPSFWTPRLELAGTYDANWIETRKPLLPADYDERHVLCAPEDQRTGNYLPAGTRVEVVHMTPGGVLGFDVPAIALRFTTSFGTRDEEHPAVLSNVVIDAGDRRVMFVWQSSLRVAPTQLDYLDATTIEERSL